MKKAQFAKTSIWITIIIVVGSLLSFLKEAIIANFYGVSSDVDAYVVAITIPGTLFVLLSVSINSIVIPIYSDLLYNHSKEKSDSYISNLISIVAISSLILTILFEFLAGPVTTLFAPGFTESTHDTAVVLLRLMLPTIVFVLVDKILVGVLNVHKRFIIPSFSVYLLNLGIILSIIVLHETMGIVAACIGQIVGCLSQIIFLGFLIRKCFKFSFCLKFRDEHLIRTLQKIVPIFWSTSVGEVSAIINKMVASMLFVGSISALGYATKINSVMETFFTAAIATIVYPLYAESSAKRDVEQLNSRVNMTLSIYTFFLVPLMFGIMLFREELITITFFRGAFDAEAVAVTSQLLGILSVGIVFMALRDNLTKVFYSIQDTSTPAKNATLGVLIKIILNLTLPFWIGLKGLAISTSVAAIFISMRLLLQLTKKY